MSAVLAAQAQPTGMAEQPSNEVFANSNATAMLDVKTMNTMLAFADQMSKGVVALPKHLQGKPADCLAVVMQAVQWGMNPFAVAQATHIVNGQLGYEAKLVNAVLQQSRSIDGDFEYEYRGDGEALECRVGALPWGKTEIKWGEWLMMKLVTTRNSPLWKTNPKQQMGYLQVKNWARAFKPGAILGVYTPDELEDGFGAPPEYREMGAADEVRSAAARASDLLQGKKLEPLKLDAPKLDDVLNQIKGAQSSADLETVGLQCTQIANDADKSIARQAYSARLKELRAAAEAKPGAGAPTGPDGNAITFASVSEEINQATTINADKEDFIRTLIKALPADQQIELVNALEVRKAELRG